MTDEQIRKNAADYVYNFQPTGVITEDRLKCYIAGAHSRDEEISLMQNALEIQARILREMERDIHKLRNPELKK